MKVELSRGEVNNIILTSNNFRPSITVNLMKSHNLSKYDADEVFSRAIELQLVDLNRGTKSMFQFYVMSATRDFFSGENCLELNEAITSDSYELKDFDELDNTRDSEAFARVVMNASENLSYYHLRGFLSYIKSKVNKEYHLTEKVAKGLLNEYTTLLQSVADLKKGSKFFVKSNPFLYYIVTNVCEVYKGESNEGETYELTAIESEVTKDTYLFNESTILDFILTNKLIRRGRKTLTAKQRKSWELKMQIREAGSQSRKETKQTQSQRLAIIKKVQTSLF